MNTYFELLKPSERTGLPLVAVWFYEIQFVPNLHSQYNGSFNKMVFYENFPHHAVP